jgi:hypothetical protein
MQEQASSSSSSSSGVNGPAVLRSASKDVFVDFCRQAVVAATLSCFNSPDVVPEIEYRRRCSASEFATCVQALRLLCKQAPKESNDVVVYFAPVLQPPTSSSEQSNAEQSNAEQSGAEQSSAEQSGAEQSSAEQSSAEQSSAEQSSAEQSSAEQSNAKQSSAEQSNAKQSKQNSCTRVVLTPGGATVAVDVKTELLRHRVFLQDGSSSSTSFSSSTYSTSLVSKTSKWCSAVVSSEQTLAQDSEPGLALVEAAQRALVAALETETGTLVKKQVQVESADQISHFVTAVNGAPPGPHFFSAVRWVRASSNCLFKTATATSKAAKSSQNQVIVSLPVCAAGSLHPFAAWVAVLKPAPKSTDGDKNLQNDATTTMHKSKEQQRQCLPSPLSIRHRHRLSFTFEPQHSQTQSKCGSIRVDCTVANGNNYSVEVEMPFHTNLHAHQQPQKLDSLLDLLAPPACLQALLLANLSTYRWSQHPETAIATDLVATDLVATDLVTTDLVATDLVATDLVATDLVTTNLVAADLVAADLVAADPVETDSVVPDPQVASAELFDSKQQKTITSKTTTKKTTSKKQATQSKKKSTHQSDSNKPKEDNMTPTPTSPLSLRDESSDVDTTVQATAPTTTTTTKSNPCKPKRQVKRKAAPPTTTTRTNKRVTKTTKAPETP